MRWFRSESACHALEERVLTECDHALRTLWPAAVTRVGNPEVQHWSRASLRRSRGLLRVDHAGEVAAQALYRGQALAASDDPGLAQSLLGAAEEEARHLDWCERRLGELGGRTSRLNPLWYTGAFLSGLFAGCLGRATSLGYLAETEKQVEAHLDDHLARLPREDRATRALLEQMKAEEAGHRQKAIDEGGKPLPRAVRALMHAASRALVYGSYWL
ncbi:ubiquinone biosynthesis protein COQ7 [mine drainage metagenome]|uniref:Ubiquinone biosynthesis protein COQ7 n=1 Tax=mine drainage metagenome TaxID=410659 RepID=T1A461_9ZZZZ